MRRSLPYMALLLSVAGVPALAQAPAAPPRRRAP